MSKSKSKNNIPKELRICDSLGLISDPDKALSQYNAMSPEIRKAIEDLDSPSHLESMVREDVGIDDIYGNDFINHYTSLIDSVKDRATDEEKRLLGLLRRKVVKFLKVAQRIKDPDALLWFERAFWADDVCIVFNEDLDLYDEDDEEDPCVICYPDDFMYSLDDLDAQIRNLEKGRGIIDDSVF